MRRGTQVTVTVLLFAMCTPPTIEICATVAVRLLMSVVIMSVCYNRMRHGQEPAFLPALHRRRPRLPAVALLHDVSCAGVHGLCVG